MTGDCGLPSGVQKPSWYVLFVRSNQEREVSCHLSYRGVEHYCPSYSVVHRWQDRQVNLKRPLFPGYMFVRLRLVERLKVLTVPNVVSLVGPQHSPSVVADEEVAWIRRGVEHAKAEPHAYLKAGTRIAITSGVLSGMEGILVRQRNSTRMVVSLDSIARAFVVEVDALCTELARTKSICN